jgi:hypothetical protein
MNIILKKSTRQGKKWMAIITSKNSQRTVHFGAEGYEDYTMHHDMSRKQKYIQRHTARENWNLSGIYTAGFWSRWLLWNCTSINKSIKYIEKKFKIKIDIVNEY